MIYLVRHVGNNTVNSPTYPTSPITSISLTLDADIPEFSVLLVRVAVEDNGSGLPWGGTTVSDTPGNTYTTYANMVQDSFTTGGDSGSTSYGDPACGVWYAVTTKKLLVGNTITVTFGSGGRNVTMAVDMFSMDVFQGQNFSEVHTFGTSNFSTTTTPSSGPATPVGVSDVLLLGVVGVKGSTADGFTEDSDSAGGVAWQSLTRCGNTGITLNAAYKVLRWRGYAGNMDSQTYNPTLGTARAWVCHLESYNALTLRQVERGRPLRVSSGRGRGRLH